MDTVEREIRKAFLDTEQGQIFCRYTGELARTEILCIHQTPSSSAMFDEFMYDLPERNILAFDLPGMGDSESCAAMTMESMAASAFAVMKAINLDRVSVLGHHTGAAVALQMASSSPNKITSLILSGPPLLSDAQRKSLPEKAKPCPAEISGQHLLAMWQRIAAKSTLASVDLIERETILALRAGKYYRQAYQAVCAQDVASQLKSVTMPVLMFAGTEDVLYEAFLESAKLVEHAEIAIIAGGDGYIFDLESEQIAGLVRRFYSQVASLKV